MRCRLGWHDSFPIGWGIERCSRCLKVRQRTAQRWGGWWSDQVTYHARRR